MCYSDLDTNDVSQLERCSIQGLLNTLITLVSQASHIFPRVHMHD